MKKNLYSITVFCCIIAFLFSACELFKMDNYDEPAETLKGEVTDIATGERVLTDQSSNGIRIRIRELSWTETAPTNFDFYCMKEGFFQNTKVFKGDYNVRIDGPFIPLVRINQRGDTLADESKYIHIKGVAVQNFQVQPFLRIEWVEKPYLDATDTIRASIRVLRGVSATDFKAKIEPMGGWNDNFLDVTDIRFFISESAYVGYTDSQSTPYQRTYSFTGNDFEINSNYGFGNTFALKASGKVPAGRTVFVRAAARIRYQTEGVSRYNYNEAVRVDIP